MLSEQTKAISHNKLVHVRQKKREFKLIMRFGVFDGEFSCELNFKRLTTLTVFLKQWQQFNYFHTLFWCIQFIFHLQKFVCSTKMLLKLAGFCAVLAVCSAQRVILASVFIDRFESLLISQNLILNDDTADNYLFIRPIKRNKQNPNKERINLGEWQPVRHTTRLSFCLVVSLTKFAQSGEHFKKFCHLS